MGEIVLGWIEEAVNVRAAYKPNADQATQLCKPPKKTKKARSHTHVEESNMASCMLTPCLDRPRPRTTMWPKSGETVSWPSMWSIHMWAI